MQKATHLSETTKAVLDAVAYLLLFAAQELIRDHPVVNSFAGSDFWMNELNAGAVTSSARRW